MNKKISIPARKEELKLQKSSGDFSCVRELFGLCEHLELPGQPCVCWQYHIMLLSHTWGANSSSGHEPHTAERAWCLTNALLENKGRKRSSARQHIVFISSVIYGELLFIFFLKCICICSRYCSDALCVCPRDKHKPLRSWHCCGGAGQEITVLPGLGKRETPHQWRFKSEGWGRFNDGKEKKPPGVNGSWRTGNMINLGWT